jgi:hypothetical protein
MKTKLLKKVRSRFFFTWDSTKGIWRIRDATHLDLIAEKKTTHGALDYMCCHFLSLSQMIKWYNKLYRLYY